MSRGRLNCLSRALWLLSRILFNCAQIKILVSISTEIILNNITRVHNTPHHSIIIRLLHIGSTSTVCRGTGIPTIHPAMLWLWQRTRHDRRRRLRNLYVLINFVINNKIWIIPRNIPTPLLNIKYAEIQGPYHIEILPFGVSYCCYTISMKWTT